MRCRFHGLKNGGKDDPRSETDLDLISNFIGRQKAQNAQKKVGQCFPPVCRELREVGHKRAQGTQKKMSFQWVERLLFFALFGVLSRLKYEVGFPMSGMFHG
jgi:hypothetical protein